MFKLSLGKRVSAGSRLFVALLFPLYLANPAFAQTNIRVGSTVSSDVSAAALSLGMKTGAFKKAGLNIELTTFVQSSQKYDSIKGNAIDIDINMGAVNAAQLYSSGVPITVLRAVTPADIWAVVARPDSKLSKPADFKGKRFGVVSLSGANFAVTYLAFKTQSVDFMREVKVSALPPSALLTALDKGDIEGATIYEPYLTGALKTGRVKVLFRPGELYQKRFGEPFIALVITGRNEFIQKNRAAAAKFIAVMEQMLANLPANVDLASQALVENMPDMKITTAEAKEMLIPYMPNVIKSANDPQLIKRAQNMYDRLLEVKQLQEPVKASAFWTRL
ncbi:ABC transporter substrate-binding protein [Glaciimonas sp. PCH181]|uniref:ABC transporter substrate-binding protein n=1 Tax=Glaciimonas sp. PCH181 TaxID=2133943 RepID=UPI000D398A4F|nr:ABC transporter substrate-binding protein [Glaciimonas sp. PCH181]PUA19672.1 nitrate ABC transporter substrate-binding protein [Glaciimonas sp. PCH181]